MASKRQRRQAKRTSNPNRYTITGIPINRNGAIMTLQGEKSNAHLIIKVGRISIHRKLINGIRRNLLQQEYNKNYDLRKYACVRKQHHSNEGGSNLDRFKYLNN